MKVLLLSRYDRLGASSRLRFLDFLPALAGLGITVDSAPFFDDFYLQSLYAGRRLPPGRMIRYYARRVGVLLKRRRYDLVWVEKEALPWLPGGVETALLSGVPMVVDFDDAWYLRYQTHGNPVLRRVLGGKMGAIVRRAGVTVVGNDVLQDWAAGAGASEIIRLPTTVDLDRYPLGPARVNGFERPLVVGWIGSPSSASYLKSLAQVLAPLTLDGTLVLKLIGAGPIDLPGVSFQGIPWRAEDEAAQIRAFDVGIMPLTADPWSEGKCAYKLIQYMAAGLPVIASPVGMNRDVVRHGVNGFLAATPAEWRSAFEILRRDPSLGQRMGAEGRALVEAEYSLAAAAPRLAEALRRAAAR